MRINPFPLYTHLMKEVDSFIHPSPSPTNTMHRPPLKDASSNKPTNPFAQMLKAMKHLGSLQETPHLNQPLLWRKGSASLRGHLPDDISTAKILLLIPPLINRSSIFDLLPDHSMTNILISEGLTPIILDFDSPPSDETNYCLDDYLIEHISPAIEHLIGLSQKPISLLGYCMGGIMALAAAQRHALHINHLTLVATPWNFHANNYHTRFLEHEKMLREAGVDLDKQQVSPSTSNIAPAIPAALIQTLFTLSFPETMTQKYNFLASPPSNPALVAAVEEWSQNGIDMTLGVFTQMQSQWLRGNQPFYGNFMIDQMILSPESLTIPSTIIIPKRDVIVPHEVALPLAQKIKGSRYLQPDCGHVSVMHGSGESKRCFIELATHIHQAYEDMIQNTPSNPDKKPHAA